jgi:hypothetical protein
VLSSRSRFADLDASQHRHGCFESLVSGTLVVGGKTIEFAVPPLTVYSLCQLLPAKYPGGQPCFTDDHLTTMMMVVARLFGLII